MTVPSLFNHLSKSCSKQLKKDNIFFKKNSSFSLSKVLERRLFANQFREKNKNKIKFEEEEEEKLKRVI